MRDQGKARFRGQVAQEQAVPDPLDLGVLPNSQAKPVYSLKTSWIIGSIILLSMISGIAAGIWGSR